MTEQRDHYKEYLEAGVMPGNLFEPTQEQIKEFWEWCGFRNVEGRYPYRNWRWAYGETHSGKDDIFEELPVIDPNNLFKYAEQPLVIHFIETTNTEEEYRQAYYDFLCKWLEDYIWNEPHDPALALFWALWQVKERK